MLLESTNRIQRDRVLLALIAERPIGTQQELVAALQERGLDVTQATVSRDIKRLGLVKMGSRYAVAPQPSYVIGMEAAEGMLVVKTRAGRASAVACQIDEAELPQVVATLAGDDTILVLVRRKNEREAVQAALEEML